MGVDEGNLLPYNSYGCRNDNGKFPNTHLRTYILPGGNFSTDNVLKKYERI